jgi:DNA-binding GntR family transcriptional regulator
VAGDFLPPEQQLCDGFGVARSTLRRAMGDLESRGLISRTRGRGTQVEGSAAIDYRPETSYTIWELIAASHREPRSIVHAFEPVTADDAVASLTGFPIGTPLFRVVRDRYASDVPIGGLENFVLAEAVSFGRDALTTGSLDTLLHAAGWMNDRVDYELSAVLLDERLGRFMDLPQGTPALRERRRAFCAGRLFNVAHNTYHPVNYRFRGVVDEPHRGMAQDG